MKCEIEFLAVGDGSRAGDAIVVRYGEESAYQLMLVDGGTLDTGDKIVSHLAKHFGTYATLEHVVLTHSDADHASGLRKVLEQVPVKHLWLHIPWSLSEYALPYFKDKRWTKEGLSAAIKKEYDVIAEVVELAVKAKCELHYAFQGDQIGPFTVLSPAFEHYIYLLPQFDKTPDPDQALIESASMWIGKPTLLQELIAKALEKVQNWIQETWETERLKDGGATSASNESSVVLYGQFDEGKRVLLTGDAGVRALNWAADFAVGRGLPLQQFSFVQIPHHGSRRNVGPTVLNRLLGAIQPEGTPRFTAFVSAPKDDSNHPRKIVINAFLRRGAKVIGTQGSSKIHYGGFPKRAGYSDAEPLGFSAAVEDYD